MAMTAEQFSILMEPKLRQIFFDTYTEKEEQFTKVFNTNKSEKRQETDWHGAGLGMWPEHDGSVKYQDFESGDEVTYTHSTFSHGVQVPFEVAEDDLYDVIGPRGTGTQQTEQLAKGARARVEVDSADILNNAFTNTGYNGKSLIDDDHPLVGDAETMSNRIGDNETLDEAAVKTARLQLRKQVNERNLKIQAIGKQLVVPADKEYDALEITQSTLKTGTDHNDKNVIGPMINEVTVLDYLTDDDAWFMLDPDLHELNFFWRVRPEFMREENIDQFVIKFVGRMRFSVGYSNWRGIVGSDGTGSN